MIITKAMLNMSETIIESPQCPQAKNVLFEMFIECFILIILIMNYHVNAVESQYAICWFNVVKFDFTVP